MAYVLFSEVCRMAADPSLKGLQARATTQTVVGKPRHRQDRYRAVMSGLRTLLSMLWSEPRGYLNGRVRVFDPRADLQISHGAHSSAHRLPPRFRQYL